MCSNSHYASLSTFFVDFWLVFLRFMPELRLLRGKMSRKESKWELLLLQTHDTIGTDGPWNKTIPRPHQHLPAWRVIFTDPVRTRVFEHQNRGVRDMCIERYDYENVMTDTKRFSDWLAKAHVTPCSQTTSDLPTNLPPRHQHIIRKQCLLPKSIGDDRNRRIRPVSVYLRKLIL